MSTSNYLTGWTQIKKIRLDILLGKHCKGGANWMVIEVAISGSHHQPCFLQWLMASTRRVKIAVQSLSSIFPTRAFLFSAEKFIWISIRSWSFHNSLVVLKSILCFDLAVEEQNIGAKVIAEVEQANVWMMLLVLKWTNHLGSGVLLTFGG